MINRIVMFMVLIIATIVMFLPVKGHTETDRFKAMSSAAEFCVYKTKLSVGASYFFIKNGVDYKIPIYHDGPNPITEREKVIIDGIIEEARSYYKKLQAKNPTKYIDPQSFGDQIYNNCMGI